MASTIRPAKTDPRGGIIIPACLLALLLGFGMLNVADASSPDAELDATQQLIGATFLAVVAALTITSLSRRMQVCYQLAYTYFVVYLILPGYSHSSINIFPFYSIRYADSVRWIGALIVAIFCAALIGTQVFGSLLLRRGRPSTPGPIARPNFRFIIALWLVVAVSACLFLAVVGTQFAFATRGTAPIDAEQAIATLAIGLPRTIGIAALAYAIGQAKLMRNRLLGLAVVLIFVVPNVVVNFPTSIPRSTLFGLVLFVSFSIFNFKTTNSRGLLSLLFVFGAVVAMPVSDALVRGGQSITEIKPTEVASRYFESGDFDGLQSLNNAAILRNKQGLQNGRHFLASMFFFIPRAVWSSKAEPTGKDAAEAAGFSFTNISMPLPGEFFVDFGYFGVLIGGIGTGLFMLRLDRWINQRWDTVPGARFVAGAFVGNAMIVFRGSLSAVIGPSMVLVIVCLLVLRYGYHYRGVRRAHSVFVRSSSRTAV